MIVFASERQMSEKKGQKNMNFDNWWLMDPKAKLEPKCRLFEKISVAKFKEILVGLGIISLSKSDWIVYSFWDHYREHKEELSQYYQDIRVVNYDNENNTNRPKESIYAENLIGIHELPNGLTFLGTASGGDWEVSVFHMTYWDGEKIRGYIPFYGNIWNKRSKKAFEEETLNTPTDFLELRRLGPILGFEVDQNKSQKEFMDIIEGLYNESLIFREIDYIFVAR